MNEDRDMPGADGSVRKSHYGSSRQPWDDIKDQGWAPHFAAGNVLKYIRRTKSPEHSLESARWYWARLDEMIATRTDMPLQRAAMDAKDRLMKLLTNEEFMRLIQ